MILKDKHTEFKLEIYNYELAEKQNDEYDSNWLIIDLFVSTRFGSWNSHAPMLLTWEVLELLNWLKSILNSKTKTMDISFMEPNIKFKLIDGMENNNVIRIYLGHEATSKGILNNCEIDDIDFDEFVDIVVTTAVLSIAIDSLENSIKKFPIR